MSENKLTPEEKQTQLNWYRDVLIATLDYQAERYETAGASFGHYFLKLKEEVVVYYQKGSLVKLKKWLHDCTEEQRETADLNYGRYIKEKTGHDFDVSGRFEKRIARIIQQQRIKTEAEYRDVLIMVDQLCQQPVADKNRIDGLNKLLLDFDSRKKKNTGPKGQR